MGRRSAQALKNFLAAIYSITIVLVAGLLLLYTSTYIERLHDYLYPQGNALKVLRGDLE